MEARGWPIRMALAWPIRRSQNTASRARDQRNKDHNTTTRTLLLEVVRRSSFISKFMHTSQTSCLIWHLGSLRLWGVLTQCRCRSVALASAPTAFPSPVVGRERSSLPRSSKICPRRRSRRRPRPRPQRRGRRQSRRRQSRRRRSRRRGPRRRGPRRFDQRLTGLAAYFDQRCARSVSLTAQTHRRTPSSWTRKVTTVSPAQTGRSC